MSTPVHPPIAPHLIDCSICRREIPLSSVLTPEGAEYVGYFCGVECYEAFMADEQAAAPEQPGEAQK